MLDRKIKILFWILFTLTSLQNYGLAQVSTMEASTPLFSTGRPEFRTETSNANRPTTTEASPAIYQPSNSTVSSPSSFTEIQPSNSTRSPPSTPSLLSTGTPITAAGTVTILSRTTSKNPDSDQPSAVNNLPFIISTCVIPPVISAVLIGLIALFYYIIRSRRYRRSYREQDPPTDIYTSSNAALLEMNSTANIFGGVSSGTNNPPGYGADLLTLAIAVGCYHPRRDSEVNIELETNNDVTNHDDASVVPFNNSQEQHSKVERPYSKDDFELIRIIGRGSFGKVMMVECKRTRQVYAMKIIKKQLVTDDKERESIQTEKSVFETALNHPFLVGLHSSFQTDSQLIFVMEFVRGGDLLFHMQRRRRLPEENARFYSAEIALALNFLHENGIIHRDLKLDNILIDDEGHIKVTDYGTSKVGIRPGDTTSSMKGTPHYMAPEIIRGKRYSFSVDWWSLGVLLCEMLTGRPPFDLSALDNPDQDADDYLFHVILEKEIDISRSPSVEASSILNGFLNKNPVDRLGCRIQTGFADIANHPFFKTIDWEMLEKKQVAPPYIPHLNSNHDVAHFSSDFTREPVQLTLDDDPEDIELGNKSTFTGFDFVNPFL